MKLIVDAGSSKVHWCALGSDGQPREWVTDGVNALHSSADELCESLSRHVPEEADEVHYYGAGCVSLEVCDKVRQALGRPDAEVASDLLAAARSLLGDQPGVACILGTGSNSGLYDGREITANVAPLGYILGDEGSGASLGRSLLRAVYRGRVDLRRELEQWLGMDYTAILHRVYAQPRANAFLASLVPFMLEHKATLSGVITEEFQRFFREVAGSYGCSDVALTGGVASAFEPEIRQAAPPELNITKIERRPMSGLITYHLTH